MKRVVPHFYTSIIALAICALLFTGCGPQEPEPTPTPADTPTITVTGSTATVPVQGGDVEFQIKYNTAYSVEIEQSAQSWLHFVETRAMQSGTLVFTVDANEGAARTGKATVKDNGGKVETITLTFEQDPFIAVTSVQITPESVELEIGQTQTLAATVTPDNAMDKTVTWDSDDTSVATVEDGKVTALKVGEATITATAGGKKATCKVTVLQDESGIIREALMEIYNTMGGPDWKNAENWGSDADINEWQGVEWNKTAGELALWFNGNGLKGEFPDCFDKLTSCVNFWIQDEPDLTGTLPQSFSHLKKLRTLIIEHTSMTSLPELFEGMPLGWAEITGNNAMAGPLPETLGLSDGLIADDPVDGKFIPGLTVSDNGFTGALPESWLRLGTRLNIYSHKLDGQIPDYFYSSDDSGYWINMYINHGIPTDDEDYRKLHPFAVKDSDIPGYWPEQGLSDVITGEQIPYKEIISKNKATVIYRWGSWCNYSATLLPLLKTMYEKYHNAGLEVIMYTAWGDSEGERNQKEYVLNNGYDIWYNALSGTLTMNEEAGIGSGSMPFVNIIDNKGNIIFSCSQNVSDPSRNRFGHIAYYDLIPFLEDIFGPLEEGEEYESTDYSRDGQYYTLQQASTGRGINVVFMGDAYTDKDIDNGTYDWMMRENMNALFAIEPFKSFRDRFNVYVVRAVSKHGKTGNGRSTAFGAVVSNQAAISGNTEKCYEYALKVPEITDKNNLLIGVLVNSRYHGGITVMDESLQSSVAFYSSYGNEPSNFGAVLRHEAGGHGFAFLADEYATQNTNVTAELIAEYDRLYREYGWYANIDFTNDPNSVKWRAFLPIDHYKDEVGIYEGAGNYTKGAYRPSMDSMMNQNVEYYNAPSRLAIYKRIMELSGEEYYFEKFLDYDSINCK
ncbi:MAG: Ig-like domain-containing protein [Bacteroidales bacterium]|nr:Ig-like domain-containing protein [Bacteroidales bacterium]